MINLLLLCVALCVFGYLFKKRDVERKLARERSDAGEQDVIPSGYLHPVEGTFDMSYFTTADGKFQFPYYETDDNALVYIKDVSKYEKLGKALEENGAIQDGRIGELSFHVFNQYIDNYLDFDIEDFWSFMEGLREKDLSPYTFMRYYIRYFQEMVYDLEDDAGDHLYFRNNDFVIALCVNGLCSEYEVDASDADDISLGAYVNSLNEDELRRLAESHDIDSSLDIFVLIEQLTEKIPTEELPAPVVVNDKFYEMLQYFYVKYLAAIQDAIDDWHPVYIEAVWALTGDMVNKSGLSGLEAVFEKLIETEYWKSRLN